MDNLVTITVDGQAIQAPKGSLLWEVCRAHGIDIPIFCYHTKLGPVGACRTCLVELAGNSKGPITACSTEIADGMVVRTKSPTVQKAQRGIFEFLLANHPLDCPICDRGGECPLQDQTFAFGPGTSRYIEPKRHHVKPITLGPTIALDRERCVLCWRCVRFCADVAEDKSIILLDRGDHTIVGTYRGEPYESNFSGNVVELCPVGALTSRKQRFGFRPWELQNRPSICPHCPMGCNINISVRKNDEVIRFLSRDNPEVDDSWLCDRGRFGFPFIDSPKRLKSPLIRDGDAFVEVSWDTALGHIADRLLPMVEEEGPESVAGLASARLTNEDLFAFRRFMTDVIGSPLVDRWPGPRAGTNDASEARNRLNDALMPIAGLERAKTILIAGTDPSARAPVLELRIRKAINTHGAKLVVVSGEPIPLSSKAAASVAVGDGGVAAAVRDLTAGNDIAREYLGDGPVAVIYDPMLAGEDELQALSELVQAMGSQLATGTLPMLDECNSMGAHDLGLGSHGGAEAYARLTSANSRVRAAFLLGVDILAGASASERDALSRLELLVVHELFFTETAAAADVVLPAVSFAEKTGTFTNLERRVQSLVPALPPPGIARPDWEILVDLSQRFERPLGYTSTQEIWDDISREVPVYADTAYLDLGPRGLRLGRQPAGVSA